MLILDTSGLLAALDRTDKHHDEAVRALQSETGPFIVPACILAEIAYMVERDLGLDVLDAFLSDIQHGAFRLDHQDDLDRIRALMHRYRDLPLGFADAAVIACAERHAGLILTFDFRHFSVVAREGTVQIVGLERD